MKACLLFKFLLGSPESESGGCHPQTPMTTQATTSNKNCRWYNSSPRPVQYQLQRRKNRGFLQRRQHQHTERVEAERDQILIGVKQARLDTRAQLHHKSTPVLMIPVISSLYNSPLHIARGAATRSCRRLRAGAAEAAATVRRHRSVEAGPRIMDGVPSSALCAASLPRSAWERACQW